MLCWCVCASLHHRTEVAKEDGTQTSRWPKVAIEIKVLTHNHTRNLWLCRLNTFLIDATVADERIRHRHDLPVVGRIAEYPLNPRAMY